MARKGARLLGDDSGHGPDNEREVARAGGAHPRPQWTEEVWVFDGVAADGPERPSRRRRPSATTSRPDEALPTDVVDEIAGAIGRTHAGKVADRLAVAARAYQHDRYPEALRITRELVDRVPESAAARELHGLICYRLGRWREAVKHLEAARTLSGGDPSQVPVLMDCHRAQGHHRRVEALWDELRGASPSADVLVEGRLVLAEDLAESGKLDEAILLLATAGAARNLRNPGDRHLRQWYVLADLYERAGNVPLRPRALRPGGGGRPRAGRRQPSDCAPWAFPGAGNDGEPPTAVGSIDGMSPATAPAGGSGFVDLRSDTVTRPTPEMRRAMAEAEVGDDGYGDDPTVNALEEAYAERVGKPAAMFVPSGTMANQVALRVLCPPGRLAIAGRRQHVVIYEAGAVAANAGIQIHAVDDTDGTISPCRHRVGHRGRVAPLPGARRGVCRADPHAFGGRALEPRRRSRPSWRRRGSSPCYMDGARLFNAEVATGVDAARFAAPVTTVMSCLSKGLCAPVGSVLAGPADVMEQARVERLRLGGSMRQAGVIAAAGLVALHTMVERLAEDHARARRLAQAVADRWPDGRVRPRRRSHQHGHLHPPPPPTRWFDTSRARASWPGRSRPGSCASSPTTTSTTPGSKARHEGAAGRPLTDTETGAAGSSVGRGRSRGGPFSTPDPDSGPDSPTGGDTRGQHHRGAPRRRGREPSRPHAARGSPPTS